MTLTDFEERIKEHVSRSPAPGRFAAESALRHLDRAWKLAHEMPELAIFSAITADEESATAIIKSLKRMRYSNAESLSYRDHKHKTALHQFFLAIARQFSTFPEQFNPQILFDSEMSPNGEELLRVRFKIIGPDCQPKWAYPYPPLDLNVNVNGVTHDFKHEIDQLATENNAKTALKYIKSLANRRNQVLYASDSKIPNISKPQPFIDNQKNIVFNQLIVYLLIVSYPQKQQFVQQALNAFVAMLKLIPEQN